MNNFRGKVAVITGGASGIGFALGKLLFKKGAIVILSDLNEEALVKASASISPNGEKIKTFAINVADEKAVKNMTEEVYQQFGKIDYFFNNAGIGFAGEVRDMETDDWKKLFEVNVFGVINGINAVYPLMIKHGSGHIINTSSGAALAPRPGMTAYAATKHAVLGISVSLRGEAEQLGVKVSAVCPGYIRTNIMSSTTYKNIDGKKLTDKIPVKPVSAEECARQILIGVKKNKAVIVISKILKFESWVYRVFPELVIYLGKWRAKQFSGNRLREE